MRKIIIIAFVLISNLPLMAQNTVSTEAYFLDINTNARLAGIGEIGVVSSPFYKNTGVYQNPALISKHSEYAGCDIFYMPWLPKYLNDLNLMGFNGFYALDSSNAFAVNFTYFSHGKVDYTNEIGEFVGSGNPKEFYFKIAYNHSFNKYFSSGIALKYFRSDLEVPVNTYNTVNSIAIDLGLNYDQKYNLSGNSFFNTSAGLAITNLGPKISYISGVNDFIPSKLSLGLFINPDIWLSDNLRLNFELAYQADKYLIPSIPEYDISHDIIDGYDPDISSFKAIFQSFYDSPYGFSGELDEIMHRFGSEFRLNYKDFGYIAFRHGRMLESESNGDRNYQTFGYGLGVLGFNIDFTHFKAKSDSPFYKQWVISCGYIFNL